MAWLKTGLTLVALGVTGYSRMLGSKVSLHGAVPATDATTPAITTPPDVAAAQKQLKALQWVVPATTGTLVAVGAFASEQYRPEEVAKGALRRARP